LAESSRNEGMDAFIVKLTVSAARAMGAGTKIVVAMTLARSEFRAGMDGSSSLTRFAPVVTLAG
jgi:hypothetical protein